MWSRDIYEDYIPHRLPSQSGSGRLTLSPHGRLHYTRRSQVTVFTEAASSAESRTLLFSCRRCAKWMKTNCSRSCWLDCIIDKFPCVHWLPKYQWKKNISGDIIAGITVAVMHIPQGLAYAHLAHVPPIVGIYMAFLPVIVFFLFTTTRHVSVGTFAVVCLLAGDAIDYVHEEQENSSVEKSDVIEVAIAVTFMVAMSLLVMYCLHLSVLARFLSQTYISGFIMGAAIHVFTSQVKDVFGLKVKNQRGAFQIGYQYADILRNITHTNLVALLISVCTMITLATYNFCIKSKLQSRFGLILPIELFIIALATVISATLDIPRRFNVSEVGYIPRGLPEPQLPDFSLMLMVATRSSLIALVSYCITISMAFMFANKWNYHIDPRQELLALGFANLCGSFFQCLPLGCSLSRSIIQEKSGGRSQLASLISCIILLFTLLFAGPLFERLPRSVLAGIIIVSLISMLTQCGYFVKAYTMSKLDGLVWLITFSSVVLIDIIYGLIIGILATLISIFLQSTKPHITLLGRILKDDRGGDDYDLFAYIALRHEIASEISGVKIIKIYGPLNFSNANYIKKKIIYFSGVNPYKIKKLQKLIEITKRNREILVEKKEDMMKVCFKLGNPASQDLTIFTSCTGTLNYIILDLIFVREEDYTGLCSLSALIEAYENIGVTVVVVSPNRLLSMFPTVNSAVEYIEEYERLKSLSEGEDEDPVQSSSMTI